MHRRQSFPLFGLLHQLLQLLLLLLKASSANPAEQALSIFPLCAHHRLRRINYRLCEHPPLFRVRLLFLHNCAGQHWC